MIANIGTTMIILKSSEFDTPLGPMLAVADEEKLYLLKFADCADLSVAFKRLSISTKATITSGETRVTKMLKQELDGYFNGTLKQFKTPLASLGTLFQQRVWDTLTKIPFGKTESYLGLAHYINQPKAFRPVANANRLNRFAIVVPCHRVIKNDGTLCGYNGGVNRKQWLLDHERKISDKNFKKIIQG